MFPVIIVFLLLQAPFFLWAFPFETCFSRNVQKDGDVVIGAFFPLYTYMPADAIHQKLKKQRDYFQRLNLRNYPYALTFIFAIEEINRNPQLLPNVSLGYQFHNIQHSQCRTLRSSLLLLQGQEEMPNYTCQRESKSIAVLTGPSRAASAQVAMLLRLYGFPQLNFGSFDPVLSDNGHFPSLHQVAPEDTFLASGMVSLMLHFSWTWVGLMIPNDHNGLQFLSHLQQEMEKNEICLAFVKMTPADSQSYNSLKQLIPLQYNGISATNVIVIYFQSDTTSDMEFYAMIHCETFKVWVTNTHNHALILVLVNYIHHSLHATYIFSQHHEKLSGFKRFLQSVYPSKYPEDVFLSLIWNIKFQCSVSESDCSVKNCPPNATLAWLPADKLELAMTDEDYNIYNAVYAVAHALHDSLLQHVQEKLMGNEDQVMFSPWKLNLFLKNIQFNNPAGEHVHLNGKRKLHTVYDIFNVWNYQGGFTQRVKVGEVSPHVSHGQQLSLSEDMIEWGERVTEIPPSVCSESCHPGFRKSPREGQAVCCFDCTACSENEISNQTDMEQCVRCPDHQYANTDRDHCLQKIVTFLAYGDPLGKLLAGTALTFTFLTVAVLGLFVKHRDTPVVKANNRALSYTLLISLIFCFLCSFLFLGHPNTATCILQQTTFAVAFTVAVSTVLAKTVIVVLAFKVAAPGRRMRQLLVSGAPNYIIPICSLMQLTLCGVWMGTNPPFVDREMHSEHGHILFLCNKGSLTAFYCVLAYLSSLALASFTMAFLARNLPDTFNEAKFLTFSMLVFLSVWVTFLPVYHSTKGKVMVAMEVFSILASSGGLLGCIFAPKCYIIVLRPERNYLHEFREQTNSRRKKPSHDST